MGGVSEANKRDVLFLFDSGFTVEKIADVKDIDQSQVESIVARRSTQVKHDRKKNIVQDIANQNPWKDGVPEREIVRSVVNSLPLDEQKIDEYGARTLPSRIIKRTDRSDRSGEDVVLTDRIEAAVKSHQDDAVTEQAVFDELQKKRDEWNDAIAEVDDLLESED